MNPQSNVFAKQLLLLLILCLVLLGTHGSRAQRKTTVPTVGHPQARILVTKTDLDPPLKITVVKTKNREVEKDKEFVDDDEWLKDLTIRLTNRSGMTVTFIQIDLTFWRTDDQEPGLPAGWPLTMGLDPFGPGVLGKVPKTEPVPPSSEVELVLSDQEYQEIKGFLNTVRFPDSIKKVSLEVIKVGFSDGTAWNTHRIYRRNPQNVTGPLKGWTPLEAPLRRPEKSRK